MGEVVCWFVSLGIALIAAARILALGEAVNKERERRHVYAQALADVVEATGYHEPTRKDADDRFRDRFVFCGRWVESGHAPECPWQVAVRRVHVLEPA